MFGYLIGLLTASMELLNIWFSKYYVNYILNRSFFIMNFITALALFMVAIGTTGSNANLLNDSNWDLVNSEECGPIKIRSRITGGRNAFLGQYPWMARLGYMTRSKKIRFKCGGSLINQRYVLTAAHCIDGWEKDLKLVRLGEQFTNSSEDCEGELCAIPVQDIPVNKSICHPDYYSKIVKNDIGIVQLSEDAEYNEFVMPICLPHDELLEKDFVTLPVQVAGWGVINSTTSEQATTLLYVTLPVRDRCACDDVMPELEIDESQYCVGLSSGEDSCVGDSGGPMMRIERVMDRKKYYLLGVVSVGKNYCGEAPAVYTKVIWFLDWILDTIAENEGLNSSDSSDYV